MNVPPIQTRQLEGSFLKEGCPYSFWAFFPDGGLTGIVIIWAN